jgi:hypothetical protein
MPFVRQPADHELAAQMRGNPQWMAYGGDWAFGAETGDCLYFSGCDVLDPTMPRIYGLRTLCPEGVWGVETLEATYVPRDVVAGLASDGAPPDLLVVVRDSQRFAAPADVQRKAMQALATLLQRPQAGIVMLADWTAVNEAQAAARERCGEPGFLPGSISSSPQTVPLRIFLRELRPIAWMLLFALLVLFTIASG